MASAFCFMLASALLGVFAFSWAEAFDYNPLGYPGSGNYQNPYGVNTRRRGYPSAYPDYSVSEFRIPILSNILDFFMSIFNYIFGFGNPTPVYPAPVYPPYRH